MDNTYDFRISQPACVQAVEAYRKMETVLKNEREKQKENVRSMESDWSGHSAETFVAATGRFLETGLYEETYNKVKSMRVLLEDVLDEVNALLSICESFLDQLNSDEYVEPTRPARGDTMSRNGGILSLDFYSIKIIENLCWIVQEENKEVIKKLRYIMDDCAGLIEGIDSDYEAIEAASRKLGRIENFHDAFGLYEYRIRALEDDLNLQFRRLAEDTIGLADVAEVLQAESETVKNELGEVYDLAYLSEPKLTELMNRCIEAGDIETMKCVAGQIIAKDSSQWSAAEAMFIAQTLNYAFEKGELEIIELYTSNILTTTYTEPELVRAQTEYQSALYASQYAVKPDVAKIQLIMSCLDAEEHGLAYYTLNRLANMELGNITIESLSPQKAECGTYCVETQKRFGEIQLIFCASVPDEYSSSMEDADREFSMTVCDVGEIIPSGKLLELRLSEVEIEKLRLSVVNDTDIIFMEKLANKQYTEMFDISPDELSTLAGEGLTDYILLLETHFQTDEIEDVVNAALQTDREHNLIFGNTRGKYITLICDNLINEITDLNEEVLHSEEGSDRINVLAIRGEKAYMQYGLWKAIGHIYSYEFGLYGMEEVEYDFNYGFCHAEISDLTPGSDNMYDFQFRIAGAEYVKGDLENKVIDVNLAKLVDENYFGKLENIEIKGLEEQKKEVAKDAIVDGIMAIAPIALTEAEFIYPIVELLLDDDYCDMAEKEIDAAYNYYKEQTKIKRRIDVEEFASVVDAFFAYDEINEQIEAKKNLLKNVMFSQAIDIDFYLQNAEGMETEQNEKIKIESQVAKEGVVLPGTTYNVSRFSDKGIAALLADMGKGEDEIGNIKKDIIDEFSGYGEFGYLIEGGDISQITPDVLFEYMEDLESFLKEKGRGNYDICSWLRGEKVQ